jgi:glycosyltransferase involved in cell wall biosynthesis
LPLAAGYAYMKWFHKPSGRLMVATPTMRDELSGHGFRNISAWSRGVDTEAFRPRRDDEPDVFAGLKRPIFLYVGRVAVEKNVEAFLQLDLPGSKWVVGDGPALAGLKARYPSASYLGVLEQPDLAKVYASADVFVFPSRTDTFGLVLLEALASGLPVAAYPVTGPIDVLGDSPAGVMHEDLREACLEALRIDRVTARAHAEKFSWRAASEQFLAHLRPLPASAAPQDTTAPTAAHDHAKTASPAAVRSGD